MQRLAGQDCCPLQPQPGTCVFEQQSRELAGAPTGCRAVPRCWCLHRRLPTPAGGRCWLPPVLPLSVCLLPLPAAPAAPPLCPPTWVAQPAVVRLPALGGNVRVSSVAERVLSGSGGESFASEGEWGFQPCGAAARQQATRGAARRGRRRLGPGPTRGVQSCCPARTLLQRVTVWASGGR
mgnify:CR=1 FL=1